MALESRPPWTELRPRNGGVSREVAEMPPQYHPQQPAEFSWILRDCNSDQTTFWGSDAKEL